MAYAPAAPQRNTLIFVVSILMLIGALINFIAGFGVLALLGAAGGDVDSAGILVAAGVFAIVAAILGLVAGVMGIRHAANRDKASLLFNIGIGLCGISLISLIITIVTGENVVSGIFGFALPILYMVGANNLKKQA
jgi:hypothetical protein